MGSKNKLLTQIWRLPRSSISTPPSICSGSGVVSYMLKTRGKAVVSNDYMAMSAVFAKEMVENNRVTLTREEAETLLEPCKRIDHFVEKTFRGLYFSDHDNRLIDVLRANIKAMRSPYRRAIAMSALIRACLKKRPRGIFTYVGHRYDDGRKDLQMSFRDQFLGAVEAVNGAVFDNGQENKARYGCITLCAERGLRILTATIHRTQTMSMCAATTVEGRPETGRI